MPFECHGPSQSSGVHLMAWPLHNHLAVLQFEHDAVAVAVGVCAAVFGDLASVWNGYAVIVVTHYMDVDECWNTKKKKKYKYL